MKSASAFSHTIVASEHSVSMKIICEASEKEGRLVEQCQQLVLLIKKEKRKKKVSQSASLFFRNRSENLDLGLFGVFFVLFLPPPKTSSASR